MKNIPIKEEIIVTTEQGRILLEKGEKIRIIEDDSKDIDWVKSKYQDELSKDLSSDQREIISIEIANKFNISKEDAVKMLNKAKEN